MRFESRRPSPVWWRGASRRQLLAAWLIALAWAMPASGRARPPGPTTDAVGAGLGPLGRSYGVEAAATSTAEGQIWIGANDLARLLGATKFWRPDVRKLVLRTAAHRVQLTVDNPFVLIDDMTVRLPVPVVSVGGELRAPVALVDSLPRDSTLARLLFDRVRGLVVRVPASGVVGTPRLAIDGRVTRISFPAERPEEVVVSSRSRAHFRVRLGGLFVGALPDTFPAGSLVRRAISLPATVGSRFEFELDPSTGGFQIVQEVSPGRLELVFARGAREDLEPFAPEGRPGPRPLEVVVLDPGHGGSDAGVEAGGLVEKDLTLSLARLVRDEIGRRMSARVVLTRDDDRDLPAAQRAERANRSRASVVISLHFDGYPGPMARGASAYCPAATFASADGPGAESQGLALLPWRDVASRHAVQSRELSEDILWAFEAKALGPTRLREFLPYALIGVNAPGLVLECAALTSPGDRARVSDTDGLIEIAAAIVDGLEAYQRNE